MEKTFIFLSRSSLYLPFLYVLFRHTRCSCLSWFLLVKHFFSVSCTLSFLLSPFYLFHFLIDSLPHDIPFMFSLSVVSSICIPFILLLFSLFPYIYLLHTVIPPPLSLSVCFLLPPSPRKLPPTSCPLHHVALSITFPSSSLFLPLHPHPSLPRPPLCFGHQFPSLPPLPPFSFTSSSMFPPLLFLPPIPPCTLTTSIPLLLIS